MKTVFFIRHAKSSWSDQTLDDFDRPLNNRGKSDVLLMANKLSEKIKKVDLILSSTAKRALATTYVITSDQGIEFDKLEQMKSLYHASSREMINILAAQNDKYNSIAIIAHNPGLTYIAHEIGNVKIDNLPTTGILAFEFDVEEWKNIIKSRGKLLFFDYPKKYKT